MYVVRLPWLPCASLLPLLSCLPPWQCESNGVAVPKSIKEGRQLKEVRLFQAFQFELSSIEWFPGAWSASGPSACCCSRRLGPCYVIQHLVCAIVSVSELEELEVIQSPLVTRIHSLDSCYRLTRLWLSECQLTEIQGLHECRLLVTLNLDGNRIRRIQGLEKLEALQQLWLNSNQLTTLEGLSTLTNLTQLWVGRNKIEHIGNALDKNLSLTELNIADNKIGCFKDLDNLGRLPNLSNLALNDPHFNPNPVCMLCNYQTYALFQLTQLTCLDSLAISDDAKHLAQATFSKKKMYYNMRIKTLKRNTTNVLRRAQSAMEWKVADTEALVQRLERLLRDADVPLRTDAVAASGVVSDHAAKLRAALKSKYGEVERIQGLLTALKAHLSAISEQHINRMVLELTTGGMERV
jgi:Leucine-rich repeat (LRR) protein